MICPFCNKTAEIPHHALLGAKRYDKVVRVVTECCGNIVLIGPRTIFEIAKPYKKEKYDDWGREPFNKKQ